MQLRKVIYDLRYEPIFSWMDKKGKLLQLIKDSKIFTELGGDLNKISATKKNEDIITTFVFEINRCSGLIESNEIKFDKDIKNILQFVNSLLEEIGLNKETIVRMGVRFHFINKMSFKDANDFFISMMSPDLKSIIKGDDYIDSAIVPVIKQGDRNVKFQLGPIKRKEYPLYFIRSKDIDYDEGRFFDIDYFSDNYHSLRVDKFADEAISCVANFVKKLDSKMQEYEKDIK